MKAERKSFMKVLLKIAADMMAEYRGMAYRQAEEVSIGLQYWAICV